MDSLKSKVNQAFIIAHQESTHKLEACLKQEGFHPKVLKQVHKREYNDYSQSYLCLLNHCNAWQHILTTNEPALICEADFVPVENFGNLPAPWDTSSPDVGLAWLYTCAPQIYSVPAPDYAVGFSTSLVAYVLMPAGAQYLLKIAELVKQVPGPTRYCAWDSTIEWHLREHNLECYLPWRNYGEHGGKPNPEHKRAGLNRVHRADVLSGRLAFTPLYAAADKYPAVHIILSRMMARIRGIGRLLLGRYLRPEVLSGSNYRSDMLKFAITRQLTLRL
ncbi:MAG: LPS biosynthesis glycosyltransferase [Leptolyngbyaceae cyanobacterium]